MLPEITQSSFKEHLLTNPLIHDLVILHQEEILKEEENNDFRRFLKQQDGSRVDKLVHALNAEISTAIDCTTCGNCCRSLMINVEPGEPERLAEHLQMPVQVLKEKYIEESLQGKMIVNTIPCHFLSDKKCNVYEYRFTDCRDFPHLHKPGFTQRSLGTFMHYGRCPIIFNVIESLKTALQYDYNNNQ